MMLIPQGFDSPSHASTTFERSLYYATCLSLLKLYFYDLLLGKYIDQKYKIKSSRSLSFMMYETQVGPKTKLGTYNGNHNFFIFWPISNHSTSQLLPNKHPGLTAMSK